MNSTPDGEPVVEDETIVNKYALLGADVLPGETSIKLSATTSQEFSLQPHDLLLIIQSQGAAVGTADSASFGEPRSLEGAGLFELVGVREFNAATKQVLLYDWCGGLKNRYSAALTQVIRVPQYQNLVVASEKSVRARAWDGQVGGVLAIRVADRLVIDGTLTATGAGFRGGVVSAGGAGRLPNFGTYYRSFAKADGGAKGESTVGSALAYALIGPYGRGAIANGGGGGNRILAGGGGGANGDSGDAWSGAGVMPGETSAQKLAWPLDPAYTAAGGRLAKSSGGGRGGYSYSLAINDATQVGPGDVRWGGDLRRERGGLGGRPNENAPTQRLFMGGGGGGGDSFDSTGGTGGSGGGVILVIADRIEGGGRIVADGNSGGSTGNFYGGGGGGGGGGTIVVVAKTFSDFSMTASGGAGGDQELAKREVGGPGGGGGGGYIAIPQTSATVRRLVSGGRAGTSISNSVQPFSENGATAGAAGTLATLSSDLRIQSGIPICGTADLEVQLTAAQPATSAREPTSYTLVVNNNGPSPAAGVVLGLQAPESAEVAVLDGADAWKCTSNKHRLTCERPRLPVGDTSTITVQVTPPYSAPAALISSRIDARSADPDDSDNTSEVSIDIAAPLTPRGVGGGIACALSQSSARGSLPALGALLLPALALLLRRRHARHRQGGR